MNLYVVRHGKTDWNINRLVQGQSDIPLNDEGRCELLPVKNKLAKIKFDAVICSPLSRAYESAMIITDEKYPIIKDERIIERACGEYEGKPVNKEAINKSWILNYDGYTKGEETVEDALKRTKEFLEDLKNKDYKNVLVVSHGGAIKALHYNIVGYDDKTDFSQFYLKNGQVKKYVL